jgi:diacylglycerol kinase family enzyme
MDWLSGLNQAVEYMEKNLSGAIRYEDMARMVGCSVYEFSRVFSFVAGVPVSEYIRRRRLTQAAFDLIDCNGLLGLDVACAGVDARVAVGVHRFKNLPLVGKKLAYILSLIVEVFRGITKPMTVEMGPIRHSGPTALCCVCNGRFYGGGFCPVPEAMPDDGVLDMILVGDLSLLELTRYVGKYAKGRYKECPEVLRAWHGQEARFSAPEEMALVVDGEVLWGKEFTLRLAGRKVNFFYPAGLSW